MIPLVDGATRAVALVAHVMLSALIVFSTAWVVQPGPEASPGHHVVALWGLLLLIWVFVGGELYTTRILGFREPGWVMIPRFGVMAAVVLLAGRVASTAALQVPTALVVLVAVLRALFHVLVVMHQRVEDDGAPLTRRSEDGPEDPVVVEIPPALMELLVAIGPVVSLYLDVLRVLYGEPTPPTPPTPDSP